MRECPGDAPRGPSWAVAELNATPQQLRPGKIISGPTLFGLCDAVLWYALFGANISYSPEECRHDYDLATADCRCIAL